MKDYKRLTERYVEEEEGDFFKKGTRFTLKNAPDEEILERLAELEDKIENGTLIELPHNKIKIRDDKDADWNSQNFPKGSGGPYDYGYKGEE